jgi:hypothetical protein
VTPETGHLAVAVEMALLVCAVGGTFVTFQYVEVLWHFVGLSMALHALNVAAVPAPSVERSMSGLPAPGVAPANPYAGAS